MHLMSRGRHVHSDRIERWLGPEAVDGMVRASKDFYWPIPVHGVPGNVYAMPGGDFAGIMEAGQFMSAMDRAEDIVRRNERRQRARMALFGKATKQGGAFGSLSALVTAATTGGKAQSPLFQKTGVASNAIRNTNDLWTRSGSPPAGAAGSAAPGGKAWSSADTGAMPYRNAPTADTNHFVSGWLTASVINNTLLAYDRLFSVVKTMNSIATQAVTGVPSRGVSTTSSDLEYAAGNFCFPANPTTVLPATAHNWTVCQYTDQAGNATQSFASTAGVSACVVGGVDLVAGSWFLPLAAGDVGLTALTQMQCSALVATGTIDFVLGRPIAYMPCPVANLVCPVDGLNSAFNLTTILDDACISFLEITKPATTATTYAGQLMIVGE